jgi:hypothetical protein
LHTHIPKFTKGQFPPKIPRPAGQTRLKKYIYGGDAVLIKKNKKRFIGHFCSESWGMVAEESRRAPMMHHNYNHADPRKTYIYDYNFPRKYQDLLVRQD